MLIVLVCVVRDGSPSIDRTTSYRLMSNLRVSIPQGQVSHLICSLCVCVCVTGRVDVTGCVTMELLSHSPLLLCFDYYIFDKPSKYNHCDTHRQSLQLRLL